jgi:pimeloyl-[acyl-carrier protein] methyl ester esterase
MNDIAPIKLVLLPGLDGTGELFEPLIRCLSPAISPQVISYPFEPMMSIDELVYFVESQLPEKEFALLAESFSGLVALRLLPKISSRLTCVIFVGSFASPPKYFLLKLIHFLPFLLFFVKYIPKKLIRLLFLDEKATNAECLWLRNILVSVPKKLLVHRLRIISATKFSEPITPHCASYYLAGTGDRLVPPKASVWFKKNILGLSIVKVDAPHFMLQVKPIELAEIIAQCLMTTL